MSERKNTPKPINVISRETVTLESGAKKPIVKFWKNSRNPLTDIQKGALYKTLIDQSYIQAGVQFKLDKYYKSDRSLMAAVTTMRKAIEADPAKYFVLPETIQKVKEAIQYRIDHVSENMRKLHRQKQIKMGIDPDAPKPVVEVRKPRELKEINTLNLSPRERAVAIESMTITELATNLRQKSGRLLLEKLDRISGSTKRLDEVNISSLASVFSTTFDKAQVVTGQATENIAVLAKIDDGMTPKQSLEAILGMREKNLADKDRKNK